jgi:hypothetical protein
MGAPVTQARILPRQLLCERTHPPLYGKAWRIGTTVFLDLAKPEPHEDQWHTYPRRGSPGHPAHCHTST